MPCQQLIKMVKILAGSRQHPTPPPGLRETCGSHVGDGEEPRGLSAVLAPVRCAPGESVLREKGRRRVPRGGSLLPGELSRVPEGADGVCIASLASTGTCKGRKILRLSGPSPPAPPPSLGSICSLNNWPGPVSERLFSTRALTTLGPCGGSAPVHQLLVAPRPLPHR